MSSEGIERFYSCDDHLDLNAVPEDVWTSRLPAKHRKAGLHTREVDGDVYWYSGGQQLYKRGRYEEAATTRAHGSEDDGGRPGDPKRRLEDMDRDELQASIVYGPSALFGFPVEDPELKLLTLQAWNDWAAEEFNSYAPERLSALPSLPTSSPEEAVSELMRVAAQGHKGALFNAFEVELKSPSWDRLWAAAAETGLPLSFHIGGGCSLVQPTPQSWEMAGFAAVGPVMLCEPLSVMIYSGALERNPGCQLVLAETGVGWLPYMIARMDATFEKHSKPHPEYSIKTKPSEIIRRQVFATFEEEPLGTSLIPLLDADNLMWACDYPHPDSTWPESRKAIDHAMGSLPAETVRKITADNCKQLYKFP
jgi:predicted TIM-barrel fold metal-dependent hydrolase